MCCHTVLGRGLRRLAAARRQLNAGAFVEKKEDSLWRLCAFRSAATLPLAVAITAVTASALGSESALKFLIIFQLNLVG